MGNSCEQDGSRVDGVSGVRNWDPERRSTLQIWIKVDTVREKKPTGTDKPSLGVCVSIQVRAWRENNIDATTLKYT